MENYSGHRSMVTFHSIFLTEEYPEVTYAMQHLSSYIEA